MFDQAQRDIALLGRRLAAPLARVFDGTAGPRPGQDFLTDQRIIDDDIRLPQRIELTDGGVSRYTRPRLTRRYGP